MAGGNRSSTIKDVYPPPWKFTLTSSSVNGDLTPWLTSAPETIYRIKVLHNGTVQASRGGQRSRPRLPPLPPAAAHPGGRARRVHGGDAQPGVVGDQRRRRAVPADGGWGVGRRRRGGRARDLRGPAGLRELAAGHAGAGHDHGHREGRHRGVGDVPAPPTRSCRRCRHPSRRLTSGVTRFSVRFDVARSHRARVLRRANGLLRLPDAPRRRKRLAAQLGRASECTSEPARQHPSHRRRVWDDGRGGHRGHAPPHRDRDARCAAMVRHGAGDLADRHQRADGHGHPRHHHRALEPPAIRGLLAGHYRRCRGRGRTVQVDQGLAGRLG